MSELKSCSTCKYCKHNPAGQFDDKYMCQRPYSPGPGELVPINVPCTSERSETHAMACREDAQFHEKYEVPLKAVPKIGKYCVNCKHHAVEYNTHQCHRPLGIPDLVTGEIQLNATSCGYEREKGSTLSGRCGEAGQFFEPATTPEDI